ncbi:hypothetical protein [Parapedobacter lycopersici]|nr:hypothetical protein [Parapedobacter lycopersici]
MKNNLILGFAIGSNTYLTNINLKIWFANFLRKNKKAESSLP